MISIIILARFSRNLQAAEQISVDMSGARVAANLTALQILLLVLGAVAILAILVTATQLVLGLTA